MAECVRGKGCRIRTPACRIGKFKEIVKSKANALDFLQFLSIFYRVICVRINPFFVVKITLFLPLVTIKRPVVTLRVLAGKNML